MTVFASTAGTVTNTLNATVGAANALRNLLNWADKPHQLMGRPVTPNGVLARPQRPVPALTGGSDLLDFSDMDEFA
jgi:hypothetical protein